MNQNLWHKLALVVLLAGLFVIPTTSSAQEKQAFDLNKVRMRFFHLLPLEPDPNNLAPTPGGGRRPPAPTPGGGNTGPVQTEIIRVEGGNEIKIGEGSYSNVAGYRIRITRGLPINPSSATGTEYYMWLLDTSSNNAQFLDKFPSSNTTIKLIDRTFQNDLSGYSEFLITEEDPTANPSVPGPARILTAQQRIVQSTPTPVPPTNAPTPPQATPTGTGGGNVVSQEEPSGLRRLLNLLLGR